MMTTFFRKWIRAHEFGFNWWQIKLCSKKQLNRYVKRLELLIIIHEDVSKLIELSDKPSLRMQAGRGASEEVSAVSFCLGSGLFGSCISD